MDDTDTATIELTRGEAREVISGLAEYETGSRGRDEERALNVEKLLQREFGFKKEHFGGGDDRGYLDTFTNIFNDTDGDHEVELSRVEAREVVRGLDELEQGGDYSTDADTIRDLRERFVETFDLGDGSAV